jgi:hypothetical protein
VDGDSRDLELLVGTAKQQIAGLRADPRLANPLAGKRGAGLQAHVLDLLGAVEHRLKQRPPTGADRSALQAFARSMRHSIIVLRASHAALPWLESTRSPNINLGSLYLTEEFARTLVGPNVDLIVIPDPEFMYSTTSWPFASVINATRGFTKSATRIPVVLNYPLSDSDRLLLHPLFAHELGHPSVHEHGLVRRVEDVLDSDSTFSKSLGNAVSALSKRWATATDTQIGSTLRAWLKRWIEELLCDHLAIEATGPAFIWAFTLFVLPLNYGEPDPRYPPTTFRLSLALAHLEARGWRPYMERVAPGVTSWLDDVASSSAVALAAPFEFFRNELSARSTLLQTVARERVGDAAIDRDRAEVESDEAARLLGKLILPVGLHTALEPRAIVLGGWRDGLSRHGDSPNGTVLAISDRRLQGLVGKAIEMSVVATEWRKNGDPGT